MGNMSLQASRLVKGEIYDSLRKALTEPKKGSKTSWTDSFITTMLKEAKDNPSGPLGQLIAKQLLQDDILSALDEQTNRLLSRDKDFAEYRIYKQCYKEQRDVLLDETSKFILVNTGRRTGKTNLAARWLVKHCVVPNSPCYYIHLKFDNAIKQAFDLCVETAEKAEISIERSSKNEGIIVFNNGSFIKFCGNSNKNEADKLRGFKARAVVIDEAAYQVNMNYLINDILSPLMADYTDSQMLLISTPPRQPHTYYEKCYRSNTWTKYEWYANKNPFIPNFDAFIEDLCKKKGITKESNFIKREAYGQFAYDTEAKVYHPTTYTEIPASFKPIKYYIGVDQGTLDNDSFIVIKVGMEDGKPKAYVVEEYKWNKKTIQFFATQLKDVIKRLDLPYEIIVDSAAVEFSFELQQTYSIPNIRMAYKYDKPLSIDQLEELFLTKAMVIREGGPLWNECQSIMYVRNDDDTIEHIIADDIFHPDISDATRYAARQFIFDYGRALNIDSTDKVKQAKELDLQAHKRPQSFSVLSQRAAMLQR